MPRRKYRYYKLHKPAGVLSQFTDREGRPTIASLYPFPENVYPVGRLDMDSEGLLLLTDHNKFVDKLLNPVNGHEREYLVQVEGIPDKPEHFKKLEEGVLIKGELTAPAKANFIAKKLDIPERVPPVRYRQHKPTSWITITLTEGRNRQVRKMTAAIGFPTLRLIRIRIENIIIGDMQPGEVKELSEQEIKKLLSLFK